MSAPSPPSFDTFFNDQRRRQHSGNSISDHFHGEIPPSFPSMYSSQSSSDRPFTDEPPSLSRHGSNVSLPNYGKGRAGSLAGSHMNDVGGGPIKQESIDFDPESSSTLIATAARLPNGMPLDQTGAGYGPPFHDAMFAPSPQHAYNPYEPTQQRGSQPWTVDRNDSFQHYPGTSPYYADHSSSYPGFEYPSSGMGQGAPGRTGYGADGTGQDGFREEWLAFDRSSPYPSSAFTHNRPNDGSWSHDFLGENNNMENMLPVNEQELNELERV